MRGSQRGQEHRPAGGYVRNFLQRIQLIGIGPVPVGGILLLLLLYVVPLVLAWNAIDYLPRWFDKVALLCLGIYAYSVRIGRKDPTR